MAQGGVGAEGGKGEKVKIRLKTKKKKTSSKATEPPALFLTDVLHNCRPRVSVTNGSVLSMNPAEFLKFAIFNTLR